MYRLFILCIFLPFYLFSQNGSLELDGAITIGQSTGDAKLGVIKWDGNDFVGWNGVSWGSLTGNAKRSTMTDQDGNTYNTIIIQDNEWMTENLRVEHYWDGSPIEHILSTEDWKNTASGAWCHYDNNPVYESTFGKLYNWEAVNTGLCPTGWHMEGEWTYFVDDFGDPLTAGGRLKEQGTNSWLSPNIGANNETGFSGQGGGYRDHFGIFMELGDIGLWWARNYILMTDEAHIMLLQRGSESVQATTGHKNSGFSVRCFR